MTATLTTDTQWIADAIGPRKVGGTYRSGLYGQTYEVLAIDTAPVLGSWEITVLWAPTNPDRPGQPVSHCTPWRDDRDQIVRQPSGSAR